MLILFVKVLLKKVATTTTTTARTCRQSTVMFTAWHWYEHCRISIEQMTRLLCSRYIVEMLALLIQCTAHCTANMTGHSLWNISHYVRSIHGTQKTMGTCGGELSSWHGLLCHQGCHKSCQTDCQPDIHICCLLSGAVWVYVWPRSSGIAQ